MIQPIAKFILAITLLLVTNQEANSAGIPEYEMKAAYLYNFLLYTDWQNKPSGSIRICHMGKDRFEGALEKLTKKTVKGLPVTLRYITKQDDAFNCQAVFIDNLDIALNVDFLINLERQGILTITDQQELFERGAMVGFFIDGNRLVFDVNYYRIQPAKLSIGSQILRLARNVIR